MNILIQVSTLAELKPDKTKEIGLAPDTANPITPVDERFREQNHRTAKLLLSVTDIYSKGVYGCSMLIIGSWAS